MPRMTSDEHLAASRAARGRLVQSNDQGRLAEMGAAQLEQYGAEGRQWAQRLRQNPQAALAMANQHGGFGQIEQRLKGLIARGQAAQAASPQEAANALFVNNPDDAVKWAETQQRAAIGRHQGAQANKLDVQAGLLNGMGVDGGSSSAGGFDLESLTPKNIAAIAASGNEGLANSLWKMREDSIDRRRLNAGTLDKAEFGKFRKEAADQAKGYVVQRDFMQKASDAAGEAAKDPATQGGADFALVQSMGKMIDPNSVVRNEEGKMIVEQGSSDFRDFIKRVQNLYSAQGILNPAARLNLIRQMNAMYKGATESYSVRYESMRDEVGSFPGANGDMVNYAIPDHLAPSYMSIDTEFFESQANMFDEGEPMPDNEDEFVDGVIYQTMRGRATYNATTGRLYPVN
jgi:hypothetical protein